MGIPGWARGLPCLLVGVSLLGTLTVRAGVILSVPGDRKDATYRADNSWEDTFRTGRVGAWTGDPPGSRSVVYAFLLPPAPAGADPVVNASLTFTVVQDFGHTYNIDLYGLAARPLADAREEDNFLGGPLDPNATLIQKAIIPAPGDVANSTLRPVSTSPGVGNVNLADYLNAQYVTAGPGGDQYVLLRLNPDVVPGNELSGVTVNMADNTTGNTPVLTIEFVPEPSAALVAATGMTLMGLARRRRPVKSRAI